MSEAENVKEMQDEINKAIYDEFKEEIDNLKDFSWPFFFRVSEKYFENKEKRLVILGQETNQWSIDKSIDNVGLNKDNLIEKCIKKYDKFIGGDVDNPEAKTAENYQGNFWRFAKGLYGSGKYAIFPNEKMISKRMIENEEKTELFHCWMNLYFIEKCQHKDDKSGRPSQNLGLAKVVKKKQKDLVKKVMWELKPKVILALTGYRQDDFLKLQLNKDMNFKEIGEFKKNQLGIAYTELQKENEPQSHKVTVIRAYHPNYFMGLINGCKSLKRQFEDRVSSVSEIYQQTLQKALKEALYGEKA